MASRFSMVHSTTEEGDKGTDGRLEGYWVTFYMVNQQAEVEITYMRTGRELKRSAAEGSSKLEKYVFRSGSGWAKGSGKGRVEYNDIKSIQKGQ